MLNCLPEIFSTREPPYPWWDPDPGAAHNRPSWIKHPTGDAVVAIVGSLCCGVLVLGFIAEVAYNLLW